MISLVFPKQLKEWHWHLVICEELGVEGKSIIGSRHLIFEICIRYCSEVFSRLLDTGVHKPVLSWGPMR